MSMPASSQINSPWKPPFYLYNAGRGIARSRSYRNDVSQSEGPQRLLVKHTISGAGVLYAEGKRFQIPTGTAFIIERPGPYIYCLENTEEPWHFEFISISFTNPGGLLPVNLKKNPIFHLENHPTLKTELADLIDLRLNDSDQTQLHYSASAYHFFLSYISAQLKEFNSPVPAVRQTRVYLEEHYSENISISDCAEFIGYTQEALTRLFSRTYGIPPNQYLRRLRIRNACELLRKGNIRMKEIADRCGFSNQNYFSRTFRQSMGITPSEYQTNPDPLLHFRQGKS